MISQKGFSLIELVLAIVIIGIVIIPTALRYQEAMHGSCQTKVLTIATGLAEDKMEESLGLGYSNVADESLTSFGSPFDDYGYQVTVHYVNEGAFDTSVDPTVTDYKSVEIQVSHSLLDQAVVTKSVLTNH